MKNVKQKISSAYKSALDLTKSHYENFPVAPLLIPGELRKHIAIVYWFARTADDLADEGGFSENQRLYHLGEYENSLTELLKDEFNSTYEEALSQTIKEKNLTPQLFYDLLTAFKQDVVKKRYDTFEELLYYCQHSANPIGRLILELFSIRNEEALNYSDKICTALQLTNFYQDVEIDYQKGRIYFPQDEMKLFEVSENIFAMKENNVNLKKLLKHNIDRAQNLFNEGKYLLRFLNGRLKFEIKWTIFGGETILNKIRRNDYNIFNARPKLTKTDFTVLLIKSFFT